MLYGIFFSPVKAVVAGMGWRLVIRSNTWVPNETFILLDGLRLFMTTLLQNV